MLRAWGNKNKLLSFQFFLRLGIFFIGSQLLPAELFTHTHFPFIMLVVTTTPLKGKKEKRKKKNQKGLEPLINLFAAVLHTK